MKLSISSQISFNLAGAEAEALRSKFIDSEHVFLGICKSEDLLRMGNDAIPDISEADWESLRKDIKTFRKCIIEAGLDPQKARRRLRKILRDSEFETGEFSGHRTQRCRDMFEIADGVAASFTELFSKIDIQHLFAAILRQESPPLDILFAEFSIEKDMLQKVIQDNYKKKREDKEPEIHGEPRDEIRDNKEQLPPSKSKTPLLDKLGRDITRMAKDGKIEPVIGRSEEIKKIAQILLQKRKNNPILIGDAGVGKTCVVEGFALKAAAPDAPPKIRNFRIVELSMGSLVAGTKYRGEFEERLDNILKEAAADPNIVLFIDEIHTMVGAGRGGGAMDAGNILKPALARGDIKCIGATTTEEYRKYIEKDAALERRFQVIWIDEPTRDETIHILKGIRERFEEHHGIRIPDAVIEKAVELSMRYLPDFRLPDKSIDLIDQACSRTMLKTFSPGKSAIRGDVRGELAIEDVAKVVSERCRVPVHILTVEEQERLLNMEHELAERVLGQSEAIREVATAVRSSKAGLKEPNKPLVFLFAGSTGTGKTELAKALAQNLFFDEKRLITFDMSEYQEKHSVSKLIGSPPGYVGHEEEGQLTGKVRTNPYSVVLFDEVEKAHPEIFDIFLQIFDEGRLTDSQGRRVNFAESVIILTSNIGSSSALGQGLIRKPIGVKIDEEYSGVKEDLSGEGASPDPETCRNRLKWKEYEEQIQEAINKAFRPEFINRIRKRIFFYPLEKETIRRILTSKIIATLNERLSAKNIKAKFSDSALDLLIEKGYSEELGAREMQRVFDQNISEPLAGMILDKRVSSGQTVHITAEEQKICFEVL